MTRENAPRPSGRLSVALAALDHGHSIRAELLGRNVTAASRKSEAATRDRETAPLATTEADNVTPFELEWEEFAPRDEANRYRIYIVCPGETQMDLIATCATEAAVGLTLCTLGRDGELVDCAHGCLDTMGEPGKKWLWKPWRAMPKEVSAAGRVLRASRDQ